MPYVPRRDAFNQAFLDLDAVIAAGGDPPWRVPLVATDPFRVVLFEWPPGFTTPIHFHPRAAEIFMVLRGRAEFTIGEGPPREAGPGELMLAEPGVKHCVRAAEGENLVMLAVFGPNEDEPDETIALE